MRNINSYLPSYTASHYRRRYVLSQTGGMEFYICIWMKQGVRLYSYQAFSFRGWQLLTDVSGQPVGPVTPATSVTHYEPTLLNTPEERRPELDCAGSPKFCVYGLIFRFLGLANVDYRTEVCFACSKSELVFFPPDFQRIRLNIANTVCQSAVQYKFTKQ